MRAYGVKIVAWRSLPDDEVVDSVTVMEEFDNRCWLSALIELDSADELLVLLHLPSGSDGDAEFCVDDVLDDDELVELLLELAIMKKKGAFVSNSWPRGIWQSAYVPSSTHFVLELALAIPLLLFLDARFDARAEMRRFKSSRNSDFNGDTCILMCENGHCREAAHANVCLHGTSLDQ